MLQNDHKLTEIFSTRNGSVYQCDKDNCFWVDFGGKMAAFNVLCFLNFKRLVDKVDLAAMVDNPSKAYDVEIISPCGCDYIYVLTLSEVAEIKELLAGAKVMLELNSILHQQLYKRSLLFAKV